MAINELCSTEVFIRLGGLKETLTFQLIQLKDSVVEVEHKCLKKRKTKGQVFLTLFQFLHLKKRKRIVMVPLPSILRITHEGKDIFVEEEGTK